MSIPVISRGSAWPGPTMLLDSGTGDTLLPTSVCLTQLMYMAALGFWLKNEELFSREDKNEDHGG